MLRIRLIVYFFIVIEGPVGTVAAPMPYFLVVRSSISRHESLPPRVSLVKSISFITSDDNCQIHKPFLSGVRKNCAICHMYKQVNLLKKKNGFFQQAFSQEQWKKGIIPFSLKSLFQLPFSNRPEISWGLKASFRFI
jgi:hypothetical protein